MYIILWDYVESQPCITTEDLREVRDHGIILGEPGTSCSRSMCYQLPSSIIPRICLAGRTAVGRHTVRFMLSDETEENICVTKTTLADLYPS
jgi:hypothetical protein